VICGHPAVFEVAVIGGPDDRWGESVKALAVPRPGLRLTGAEIVERELRDRYRAGRAKRV
jgi:acyl-CoA synthetase (AMP-forming)/AMP-acid ligase II